MRPVILFILSLVNLLIDRVFFYDNFHFKLPCPAFCAKIYDIIILVSFRSG